MIAHIAKLTNAVVAIENDEPVILMRVLVIEILFNMSYNQIINKMFKNAYQYGKVVPLLNIQSKFIL
jgi:hypothetical protein